MKKKKYNIGLEVLKVDGTQTWTVEAYSKIDALKRFQKGEGDISFEDLDVQGLSCFNIKDIYLD